MHNGMLWCYRQTISLRGFQHSEVWSWHQQHLPPSRARKVADALRRSPRIAFLVFSCQKAIVLRKNKASRECCSALWRYHYTLCMRLNLCSRPKDVFVCALFAGSARSDLIPKRVSLSQRQTFLSARRRARAQIGKALLSLFYLSLSLGIQREQTPALSLSAPSPFHLSTSQQIQQTPTHW